MIIRDTNVYQSEINWFAVAVQDSAAALEAAAASALASGDQDSCLEYAELSLVLSVRGTYHTQQALFLAELEEDPGDPPEVPAADTLCPASEEAEEKEEEEVLEVLPEDVAPE